MSNGKPQCELRHLAFCNSDSIARARSGAERSLATSKSQRVCVCVCGRHPHQCYEFHFVSKTSQPGKPPECISRRAAWRPKYRAHPPDDRLQKRTIKCASFETTVGRNWQSLRRRQMRSSDPTPVALWWNVRVLKACADCARPYLHRKWPLVSVLINAGMKLRRHYLRHTERRRRRRW